jgi:hypothetical protein
MANNLLTIDEITREALLIFHQKATFLGSINRQYDDSFAKRGAKIGDSLRIRLPNEYVVGDGESIVPQATDEQSTTLRLNRRKHVALQFTSEDRTLKLDDFSARILDPAVSVLVANVEADAISMLKDLACQVDQDGTAFSFDTLMAAREVLNNNLVPNDGRRTAILKSSHARKIANELKSNQNPIPDINKIIREGLVQKLASFGDIYESSHVLDLTTGTAAEGDAGYLTNQVAAQDDTESLVVDTGTATFKRGEIIEVEGVNEVHPETKQDTGRLMQFTLTADVGASATALPISPKLIASGARQNVTNGAANNKIIYKRGAGNAEKLNLSAAYHEDAMTFVTADLVLPSGLDMAARKQKDGISLRILQDYEIRDDLFIGRLDIAYGYKCLRPRAGVRMHADG